MKLCLKYYWFVFFSGHGVYVKFEHDALTQFGISDTVFTCDSIYAIARICHANSFCLSVCLSVRPSVTRVICVKTAERIIEILSRSDRPIILVFRQQGSLGNSEGVTPNGAPNTRGIVIFEQYAACGYISERVLDRGIVTMEDEYKVVCALSHSATFDDLE